MVGRVKARRFLYLATLVLSTIVVFEVLVFPVFRYVTIRYPITSRHPANFAEPNLNEEEPHDNLTKIPLEYLLLKSNSTTTYPAGKLWFFKNGSVWPIKGTREKVWPHEAPNEDRILQQLMHIPDSYDPENLKTILLTNNLWAWNVPMGRKIFEECPVNACTLRSDKGLEDAADVVLFRDMVTLEAKQKKDQIWIIYILESPSSTHISNVVNKSSFKSLVDWTATYRWDSDIVTPYEKWLYYDPNVKTLEKHRQTNFAAGKTHQVAWFVSNCHTPNRRLKYAKELGKHISVEIYGACGSFSCPRSSSKDCENLLNTKYKFYLSFENSNCRDYITEKFFVNGLGHNVLPIVMGATKDQYARSAPENSYIHVDDFESPQKLAEYLHLLDKNDTLYNSYFQWKGTGEFINTHFWCRLCTMIHDADSGVFEKYSDVSRWWHKGTCMNKGWSKQVTEEEGEDVAPEIISDMMFDEYDDGD